MSAPTDRAPARRPRAVLLDVFETTLDLTALRERFTAHDRPGHELELFFARTLRDGMAQSLAGAARPFVDLARAQLRTTCGLVGADADDVLAGFRSLPVHPDAAVGLQALADAGVPVLAFTHGSAEVAEEALGAAGVRGLLAGVVSTEVLHTFKPPPAAYTWGCEQVGTEPARTALLAVHSWDTDGAVRAGLLGALVTRAEGWVSDVAAAPHVHAERFDATVEALLALDD